MSEIIPTILSYNKKEFTHNLNRLLPITQSIQIDLMDGKFVNQKSISLSQIPDLKKYQKNFEVHLMVKNPIAFVTTLKRKGFNKIIFHYESYQKEKMIKKTIEFIHKNNMKAWLAINPETEIENVFPYLSEIDGVLFMGVHPGKSGQKFIPETLNKIKELRKKSKIKIQVDGGANEKTVSQMLKVGADYINAGSFVSNAESPEDALRKLNKSPNTR